MPTRWYLPSNTTAEVTVATDSGWNVAPGVKRQALRSRWSSAFETISVQNDGTALHKIGIAQYVTEPLAAQTVSGTVSGAMRCIESNASYSACVAVSVRACSNDGGTIRSGGLAISNSDLYTSGTVHEMATALTNRLLENSSEQTAIPFTNMVLSEGDRLVFEFGYLANNATGTRSAGIDFGDSSSTDLSASDTTVTAANNPWIEFSGTINVSANITLGLTNTNVVGTGAMQSLAGAVGVAMALVNTNVVGTGAVQGVTASVVTEIPITGTNVVGTGAVQSIALGERDVPVTGTNVVGTGAVQSPVSKTFSVEIDDGVQATGHVQSPAGKSFERAIAGEQAAGAVETPGSETSVALTTVLGTGAVDTVTASSETVITLPITGVAATGFAGNGAAFAFQLTGGTNSYVSMTTASWASMPQTPCTIMARFDVVSINGAEEQLLITKDDGGNDNDFWLYAGSSPGPLSLWNGGGDNMLGENLSTGPQTWTITRTAGVGGLNVYKNGEFKLAANASSSVGDDIAFGADCTGYGTLETRVSDIRVWGVVLTLEEVATENASPAPAKSANLLAWWPLSADFADASPGDVPDLLHPGGGSFVQTASMVNVSVALGGVAATASADSTVATSFDKLIAGAAPGVPGNIALSNAGSNGDIELAPPGVIPAFAVGHVGTTKAAFDLAASGVAAAGDVEVVASSVSCAISGGQATGSVDTVVASEESADITRPITGEEAATGVGQLTSANDVVLPITGEAATGAADSLASFFSLALAGEAGTGVVDTATAGFSFAVVGQEATAACDAVAASFSRAVTGEVGIGAVDSAAPGFSFAAVGVEADATCDAVSPGFSRAISGERADGAVQTPGAEEILAISGEQAAGSVDTVVASEESNDVSRPLTGIEAATGVGTVATENDVVVPLTAADAATGAVQGVAPSFSRAISGAQASGAVQQPASVVFSGELLGEEVGTGVGQMTAGADVVVPLTASEAAAGSPGSMAKTFVVAASGEHADCSVGVAAPAASFGLLGASGTSSLGAFGLGMTGVAASGAAGSVQNAISVALVGVEATQADAGTVVATSGAVVALTGSGATADVGSVARGATSFALEGVAATAGVGQPGIGATLLGTQAAGLAGTVARGETSLALAGATASSAVQILGHEVVVAISGAQAACAVSSFAQVQIGGNVAAVVAAATATMPTPDVLATGTAMVEAVVAAATATMPSSRLFVYTREAPIFFRAHSTAVASTRVEVEIEEVEVS